MTRDAKNHKAYMDVLDCRGPSMPDDPEYMDFYRYWYPLGADAHRDRYDR